MSELHAALERLGIDADRGVIDAEDRSPMQRDLLTVLKAYRAAEGALAEIAELPDMSKNPVDDFDRGVRAARLDAAEMAREALPHTIGGGKP